MNFLYNIFFCVPQKSESNTKASKWWTNFHEFEVNYVFRSSNKWVIEKISVVVFLSHSKLYSVHAVYQLRAHRTLRTSCRPEMVTLPSPACRCKLIQRACQRPVIKHALNQDTSTSFSSAQAFTITAWQATGKQMSLQSRHLCCWWQAVGRKACCVSPQQMSWVTHSITVRHFLFDIMIWFGQEWRLIGRQSLLWH